MLWCNEVGDAVVVLIQVWRYRLQWSWGELRTISLVCLPIRSSLPPLELGTSVRREPLMPWRTGCLWRVVCAAHWRLCERQVVLPKLWNVVKIRKLELWCWHFCCQRHCHWRWRWLMIFHDISGSISSGCSIVRLFGFWFILVHNGWIELDVE